VDDIDLAQYIQTLRKQHNRERVTRHSIAITLQSMEKLMRYLDRPDVCEKHGLSKCLFFQAYAATGFYLWTRYSVHVSCSTHQYLLLHHLFLSFSLACVWYYNCHSHTPLACMCLLTSRQVSTDEGMNALSPSLVCAYHITLSSVLL
jgi:hypothetical protein